MREIDKFEIDLLRICKTLWKRVWAILLCAVVLGAAVFGYNRYTYVPTYSSSATMCIVSTYERQYDFEGAIGQSTGGPGLGDARSLVGTCGAMLKTRSVLEKVMETADGNAALENLSEKITVTAIGGTELFLVTVTDQNPEETAKIANAITQVLPGEMAAVNPAYTIRLVDSALVPLTPVSSPSNSHVSAAELGAVLAFVVIVLKSIWEQWKEQTAKNQG